MDIRTSDPYVTIAAYDGPVVAKTRAMESTLNPTWNQTFHIEVPAYVRAITFTVWDSDNWSSDEFDGMAVWDLSRSGRRSGTFCLDLGPRQDNKGDEKAAAKHGGFGKLNFSAQWSNSPTSSLPLKKM